MTFYEWYCLDQIVTSVMFLSFIIVTPHWYLNRGPLDLQSNTLPLCHQGQSYIEYNFTLIIFFIIHNYDPNWYLNQGPLDLQSNTLPLCHHGQWYIEYNFTLIISRIWKNDNSFAISHTAYLFFYWTGCIRFLYNTLVWMFTFEFSRNVFF